MRKLILLVATTATLLSLTAPGALAQEATPSAEAASRATVVVLVDQSGSLSESDFSEQVRAVRTLKNVPDIDLYVYGFASEGSLPAVVQVCDADSNLDECADNLERRASDSEGNDTDHAMALASAALLFEGLGSDASVPKIVLLMTDGQFDPDGSGHPTAADEARLDGALDKLNDFEVQVWPLGFGQAIDTDELDRIAGASFGGRCEDSSGPRSVIVADVNDVPGAVNEIIGSATCASRDFDVPAGTQSLVVYYAQDELGDDGTITVTNEAGTSQNVSCDLDELSGQWVCEIPTDELGPGKWTLSPVPLAFPFPFPKPGPEEDESGSSDQGEESETNDGSGAASGEGETTTSTTAPAAPLEAESGAFPWPLLPVGVLAVGVLLWALLRNRSKLERGVVAVRMAGQSDWSPEETVRAEKRQGFEVDPDSGYPSIEATSMPAPDVVLEATPKGIFVSGSLVEERSRITLGDEIPLLDGMTLIYARTLDDDLDDVVDLDDLYEDSFI